MKNEFVTFCHRIILPPIYLVRKFYKCVKGMFHFRTASPLREMLIASVAMWIWIPSEILHLDCIYPALQEGRALSRVSPANRKYHLFDISGICANVTPTWPLLGLNKSVASAFFPFIFTMRTVRHVMTIGLSWHASYQEVFIFSWSGHPDSWHASESRIGLVTLGWPLAWVCFHQRHEASVAIPLTYCFSSRSRISAVGLLIWHFAHHVLTSLQ